MMRQLPSAVVLFSTIQAIFAASVKSNINHKAQCLSSSVDLNTCDNPKVFSMEYFRARSEPGDLLTTNQGLKVVDDADQEKVGVRGPTLLEDFIFREKLNHFDHERIPERVVHARGSAAHGYFQVYQSLANITRAQFLQDPATITPVYVRFSTVAGNRGSSDTVRDVRGFATKFYTQEGNFDLVGNNIPVFFIQDAIKFPDFVHAVKVRLFYSPRSHMWSVTWLDFYPNFSFSNKVVMNQSRALRTTQLFPFFYSPHTNPEITTSK